MSSTDLARRGAPFLLMLALGACAGHGALDPVAKGPEPLTPLDQHPVELAQVPERVALTVHPHGVISPAQDEALAGFAAAWRETGGASALSVASPVNSALPADPQLQARAIAGRLESLGVPAAALRLDTYDAGGEPGAPVVARFERLSAIAPDCLNQWDNLTSTNANRVTRHFGCAVSTNLAAMLADPRDLAGPRRVTPADAGRRAWVLDKYRQGQMTASAKDDQAAGAVSQTAR